MSAGPLRHHRGAGVRSSSPAAIRHHVRHAHPPSMGLATASTQPTGNGRAAINGDFSVSDRRRGPRRRPSTARRRNRSSPYTTTGWDEPRLFYALLGRERRRRDSPARYAPRRTPPRPGDSAPWRIPTRRELPADVVMQASCDDVLVQWGHGSPGIPATARSHGTLRHGATLCRVEPGPTVAAVSEGR